MIEVSLIGLIAAGPGGIPRYARSLIQALDSAACEFSDLSLHLVAHAAALERLQIANLDLQFGAVLARRTAREGPSRIVLEQVCALAARRSDLIHFFDLTLPVLAPRSAFTATVHDAAIVHRFPGETVWHKQWLQPNGARRATGLVADSEFAKKEAIREFGARVDQISVIYPGPGLAPPSARAALARATSPSTRARDYFLYVGNLLSHKNLPWLVSTFTSAGLAADLLIVGSGGTDRQRLEDLIATLGATKKVRILDAVDDTQLETLYANAVALLLPSLYEGFGFTVIEALARGCPVVANDLPALREVSGEAAFLLPTNDVEAWTHTMTSLLRVPVRDESFVRRATAVARQYSWERAARELCRFFIGLAT